MEDFDLVKLASDLCDCVKHAMGMIRPDLARPIQDFKQPTWLTEKRARYSLELAEQELWNIQVHAIGNDQFEDRLKKRVALLSNITFNSKSDDEFFPDPELDAIYDYHSEEEFLDEEEKHRFKIQQSIQEAWNNAYEDYDDQ